MLLFFATLPSLHTEAQSRAPFGTDESAASIASKLQSLPETADMPAPRGLQASLLTCSPGSEVYELFGHEAIRIRGIDEKGLPVDTVWNYGVFDFAAPGFLYRFVKGETDYMVEPCPMEWFLQSYILRGSGVTEQDLNLTSAETYTLRKLLQINSLPENRTYRYNYIRDNCATRPADMIEAAAAPRHIIYPDTIYYSTFRKAMREFHKNYPWYQFGIDLVLGGGLDLPVESREELFAPLLMEQKVGRAKFNDGTPLVKSTRILYAGPLAESLKNTGVTTYSDAGTDKSPDLPTLREMGRILPPTPWYLSPLAVALAVMVLCFIAGWWQFRRDNVIPWVNTLFFGILGLAGSLVWFLVFCSTHDSTSPNLLAIWLNPFQLLLAVTVWWRKTRVLSGILAAVNLAVIVVLVAAWPLQTQVANPAVWPLLAATLALSISLFAVEFRNKPLPKSRKKERNSQNRPPKSK